MLRNDRACERPQGAAEMPQCRTTHEPSATSGSRKLQRLKRMGVIVTALFLMAAGAIVIGIAAHKRHTTAPGYAGVQQFNEDNFDKAVMEASKERPIVVDFYADWCPPCRVLEPVLKEVAKEFAGRVVIGKVNQDKSLLGRRFGVSQLPTILIIKDGEVKQSFQGFQTKETLIRAIKKYSGGGTPHT
ncbi:MAG: thioredoxin domain-containing protein [Thermodesulfobacteriota bacterium]